MPTVFQRNSFSSNTSSYWMEKFCLDTVKLTNPENTKIHLNLSIFTVNLKLQTWTKHFAMLKLKLYVGIQVCMRTLTTKNQRKIFTNDGKGFIQSERSR